jgi:hypothetical protein
LRPLHALWPFGVPGLQGALCMRLVLCGLSSFRFLPTLARRLPSFLPATALIAVPFLSVNRRTGSHEQSQRSRAE